MSAPNAPNSILACFIPVDALAGGYSAEKIKQFLEETGLFKRADIALILSLKDDELEGEIFSASGRLSLEVRLSLLERWITHFNAIGMGSHTILDDILHGRHQDLAGGLEQRGWKPYVSQYNELIGIRKDIPDGCSSVSWSAAFATRGGCV